MEFLGVGPLELLFIILIALIVLGPKDMVKAGYTIGRLLRKTILSPTWLNIQKRVRNLPYEMMREAGLDESDLRPDLMAREYLNTDLLKSTPFQATAPPNPVNPDATGQDILVEQRTPTTPDTPEIPLTPPEQQTSAIDPTDTSQDTPEDIG